MVFHHAASLPNTEDSSKRDLNRRLERPPGCDGTLRVRRAEHPQHQRFLLELDQHLSGDGQGLRSHCVAPGWVGDFLQAPPAPLFCNFREIWVFFFFFPI